jgi:hypothetical protein
MAPISLIMDQEQYYYEVEIVCLDIRFGVADEWGATVLLLLQVVVLCVGAVSCVVIVTTIGIVIQHAT